ncbi:gamma-glutamylcyclotransferase-like [Thunnus albacares]|uniref:gamma-glutamylcyclotransferase a n=1 Tax=Thunnus maccoyii TaxID=8240 RepID=UPI001C4B7A56|nr:gamma-glutamylcyclotransferase a [Thunnus maccoyii]XP_044191025.1 gamma-glutamylcyclotransferase-like [Thunnus albacares]
MKYLDFGWTCLCMCGLLRVIGLVSFSSYVAAEAHINKTLNMSGDTDGRFMYFAFGSNLLKERLQLANPSAIFCTTGRLKDYILNFGLWEKHVDNAWHGGVATIEFCPGAEVWGVIWTLSNDNLKSLDNQEGVSLGKYSPIEVTVETDNGLTLCRTYQMNNFHACPPSPQYKQVVCLGAEQNRLPVEYLKRLEAIQTNNYSGPSILDQIKTVEK